MAITPGIVNTLANTFSGQESSIKIRKKHAAAVIRSGTYIPRCELVPGTVLNFQNSRLLVAKGDGSLLVKELVRTQFSNGQLRSFGSDFWLYCNGLYNKIDSKILMHTLESFIAENVIVDQCLLRNDEMSEKPSSYNPTQFINNSFMQSLLSETAITDEQEENKWASDDPKPKEYDNVFSTPGGLYNYMTNILYPHDMRMFNRIQIPITPFGIPSNTPCRYNEFIEEVLPDKDQRDLLHEYMGVLISGDTHWHTFLLKYGVSRSGKGVIDDIITYLVGKNNTASKGCADFIDKNGFETLDTASVCFMPEFTVGKGNFKPFLERIKSVVGRDTVCLNAKYKNLVNIKLPCRFVISTNSLPYVNDMSDALAKRMLTVLFTKSIPEEKQDKFLARKITESEVDRQVVLSHCIEGLRRLYTKGTFTKSKKGSATLAAIDLSLNSVKSFGRNCLQFDTLEVLPAKVIYQAYVEYCTAEQFDNIKHPRMFGKDLKDMYPELESFTKRVNGKVFRCYRGISLDVEWFNTIEMLQKFVNSDLK